MGFSILIEDLSRFFYNGLMSDVSKFLSDIQRIKKHVRADNANRYDGKKVCEQIVSLFVTNNRNVEDLARSISDYWFNTYILSSEDLENEPSQNNLDRIIAFQNFIDGSEDEDYEILCADDWETLKDFVNDEAASMDLDLLQSMMSVLLKSNSI